MMRALGQFGGVVAVTVSCAALRAQTLMRLQAEAGCEQRDGLVVECVRAAATDPAIGRFDGANYALSSARVNSNGQLLLFMPGTGGEPPGSMAFLSAAAAAGYQVISLAYNDDISWLSIVSGDPTPHVRLCSAPRASTAIRLWETLPSTTRPRNQSSTAC
jgi:hypothetical protein